MVKYFSATCIRSSIVRMFFVFLIKNNAYDSFLMELKKRETGNWVRNDPQDREICPSSTEFINNAFSWDGTYAGYDFWCKLDEEWRELHNTLEDLDKKYFRYK